MSTSNDAQRVALNWVRTGPRNTSTVVLIHAVGFDLTYWDRQIEALRSAYDVVAFDLPGHGRSAGGPHDWISFANALASLKELIANVDSGPVHLAGISFGAMIAQTMVLAYPELVRSLTLIGTAAAFPEGVRAAMRARAQATRDGGMQAVLQPSLDRWFTSQTVTQRPDLIDRVSKTVLGADPVVHAAIWELIANDFDVVARLGEIACPALIVVGERDPSTPPAAASVLAAGIRAAQHVVLPRVSHMATLEAPAAVNAHVERFLSSV